MHLGSGTRPSLLDFELSLPGKLLRTLVLHGAAPKVVQLVVRAVPASAGEKDCFDRAPLHCAMEAGAAQGVVLAGRWPRQLLWVPPLNFARSVSLVSESAEGAHNLYKAHHYIKYTII